MLCTRNRKTIISDGIFINFEYLSRNNTYHFLILVGIPNDKIEILNDIYKVYVLYDDSGHKPEKRVVTIDKNSETNDFFKKEETKILIIDLDKIVVHLENVEKIYYIIYFPNNEDKVFEDPINIKTNMNLNTIKIS